MGLFPLETPLDFGKGLAGVSGSTSGDISEGLATDALWDGCSGVLCMNRTLVWLSKGLSDSQGTPLSLGTNFSGQLEALFLY